MAQAKAVIQNGACGVKNSQSFAPIQGIGRDRMPKDVPKNPNANPRLFSGTTFDIRELYDGMRTPTPNPFRTLAPRNAKVELAVTIATIPNVMIKKPPVRITRSDFYQLTILLKKSQRY